MQSYSAALLTAGEAHDLVNAGYALRGLAEIAKESGDTSMAWVLGHSALDHFRHKGYPTGEAYALKTLADVAARSGQVPEAISLAERSVLLFQEIGKPRGIAFALKTQADVVALFDAPEAARRLYDEARRRFLQLGIRNLAGFDPARAASMLKAGQRTPISPFRGRLLNLSCPTDALLT